MSPAPLRLSGSMSLRERVLAERLAGRSESEPLLADALRDAQVLGSLELAGMEFRWDAIRAAGRGEPAPEAMLRLLRARAAVAPEAPLNLAAVRAWHEEIAGAGAGFRTRVTHRESGPPPAPPMFVEGRLADLEEWLASPSGQQLQPGQQGALALARILEIQPFEIGNGRVSRLAASHLMVRAGRRPPILVGADRARLEACLHAAFALDTAPLAVLLEEASERALQVMIQTLEAEAGPRG